MEISFTEYLRRINEGELHNYDFKSELCIFVPSLDHIDLIEIVKHLNPMGQFLEHDESFMTRKYICEKDTDWKDFIKKLKVKHNYICQVSGFSSRRVAQLSNYIFGLKYNERWINSYLTPHHLDDKLEYNCFDEDKLLILNRAIHMARHRLTKLSEYIPGIKNNYELQFELGCLIPDRDGIYPWRKITTDIQKQY